VYRRLLVAYTLNELAWSIGTVALAVLVYRRTGSAIGATAFFLCAQTIPALISPLMVARIDQRSVRRVLPVLYGIEAVAFASLAWVTARFALAPALVLALLDGVAAVSARAIARATTVAVLTPRDLLREGNALMNSSFSVCFMAGPAIGGLVVALGGTQAALIANSAMFALIALTMLTTGGLPPAPHEPAPSAGRLRRALEHARETPAIRILLSLQAVALLFFTMSVPVEVVFTSNTLRTGAGGYGALLSAWGAGAVLGSLIYARWREVPSRTLIAGGAGALGIGLLGMALSPALGYAIAAAAVAGAGNGVEAVSVRTALQEAVEPAWMTLMMSFSESMAEAVPGLGILLGGAVATIAGPRAALATAGAGALVVTGLIAYKLRPGRLAARPAAADRPPEPAQSGAPMRSEPRSEAIG
jgi:MFS family permease